MRYGILCAMDEEIETLKKLFSQRKTLSMFPGVSFYVVGQSVTRRGFGSL